MTGCCAVGCKNRREDGYKMYTIPSGERNNERRKLWLVKIKRKDDLPRNCKLCQVHFEEDQFEKNIPDKLKPNAVPTIFPHLPLPKHRKPPKKRSKSPEPLPPQKKHQEHAYCNTNCQEDFTPSSCDEVTEIIVEVPVEQTSTLVFNCQPPTLKDVNCQEDVASCGEDLTEIPLPVPVEQTSKLVLDRQRPTFKDINSLKNRFDILRKKCYKLEKENRTLTEKTNTFLNPDQQDYLKGNLKYWSEETIKKSLQIYFACGTNGYQVLIEQGYPLPSERTLRRRLHYIRYTNGMNSDILQMLTTKEKSMNEEEKKKSLSVDETETQSSLNNDIRSGPILVIPTVVSAEEQKRYTLISSFYDAQGDNTMEADCST